MVQASRTFRVFVSSTFDDLKAERNALQEKVFPRLKALCTEHGARFQAIDLRWGVSEEAGLDQQTMAICLDEVKRCQKASPKPNFIVLLGDRYGWCPLPASIEAEEFREILTEVAVEDEALLVFDEAKPEQGNGWYRQDGNAVPAVCRLRERKVAVPAGASDEQQKAAHDKEEAGWGKDEARVRDILRRAIDALGWAQDDERRIKYEASATEQEILRGALGVSDARKHVFAFFRTIANLDDLVRDISAGPPTAAAAPDLPPPEKFIDLTAQRAADERARARLDDLKRRLNAHLPGNVRDQYRARWEVDRVSRDHLDQLCDDVYEALAGIIRAEITQIEENPQLDKEIEDHERFGEERAGTRFVGRLQPLERVRAYIASADDHPLAVFGASGSGKSALMAAAVRKAKEGAGEAVVVRFIGATPESSLGRSLLFGLCRQIARRYADDGLATTGGEAGEERGPKAEADIPADYRKLSAEFPKQLARATKARPLVIFLDALDQLSATDGARGLSWLPWKLPEHVRLIVSTSTSPADCLETLQAKLPEASFEDLAPMSRKEGEELLGVWLEQAGRTLQPDQRKQVLDRFRSASVREGTEEAKGGLPLYLKLAFEEARRWRSHDLPTLHPSIRGVIRDDLFARLSAEANHGSLFVRHALGYLGAAKNGLSEDEMLEVLSLGGSEGPVLTDFRRRSPKSPVVERLPVAVWSRLYFDLEPYLTERSADGTSLMGFYHRQLGEVVVEEYLAAREGLARHHELADFFAEQPLRHEGTNLGALNLRALSELPYQQTHAELWQELEVTLSSVTFLETKCAAKMIYPLLVNLEEADRALPRSRGEGVRRWFQFMRTRAHRIAMQETPGDRTLLQEAANQVTSADLREIGRRRLQENGTAWLRLENPVADRALFSIAARHADFLTNLCFSVDDAREWDERFAEKIDAWLRHQERLMEETDSFSWADFSWDVILSPTCRHVLVRSKNGPNVEWLTLDLESGRTVRDFRHLDRLRQSTGHEDSPLCISISGDGRYLACGYASEVEPGPPHRASGALMRIYLGERLLWEGQTSRHDWGYETKIAACAINDQGMCAFADGAGRIHLANVALSSRPSFIPSAAKLYLSRYIDSMVWRPGHSGQLLVTCAGTCLLLEMPSGKHLAEFKGSSVAFDRTGRLLAATGAGNLEIWDVDELVLVDRVDVDATRCSFLADDEHLAVWSGRGWDQGTLSVFSKPDPLVSRPLSGPGLLRHASRVDALVSLDEPPRLVSSGSGVVKVTNLDSLEEWEIPLKAQRVGAILRTDDGVLCSTLHSLSTTGELVALSADLRSVEETQTLPVWHTAECLAFSATVGRIGSFGGGDGAVHVWQGTVGQFVEVRRLHAYLESGARRIEFSPDGRCVAVATHSQTAIWDLETLNVIYWQQHERVSGGDCDALFFHHRPLLVTGEKGAWELIDLLALTSQSLPLVESLLAISPDDSLLATAENNVLSIYDATTFGLQAQFVAESYITAATWCTSSRLAIGGTNGAIELLDIMNPPAVQFAPVLVTSLNYAEAVAALGRTKKFRVEALSYGPEIPRRNRWFDIEGRTPDIDFTCRRCGASGWMFANPHETTESCPSCGYAGN